MKRIQAETIFNEFFAKTFNEAYGYILAKTGDTVATPDILKESYVEFYRALLKSNGDEIENKRGYLFKIIKNHLNKYNESAMHSERPETTRIKKYAQFLEEELETELRQPQDKEERRDCRAKGHVEGYD